MLFRTARILRAHDPYLFCTARAPAPQKALPLAGA
jgi:hypothetical protein